MPIKLTFRHVETLHAVILTGSVTGAAERLHVTQPAVSNILRDIEERLGLPVFERRAGRLVPTEIARLLFEEIERSFTGLDQINSVCARILGERRRRLSVACTPVVAAAVLPALMSRYSEVAPDVFFAVHSRSAEHAAALVSSGKADVGIALDVPPIPGVASDVIARLPLVCYLPAAHKLGRVRRPLTGMDLYEEKMVTLSSGEGIDLLVDRAFSECPSAPPAIVECPAALAACSMVAQGIGFTIFDALPAAVLAPQGFRVTALLPDLRLTYRLYWTKGRSHAFDKDRFLTLASEVIEERADAWRREKRSRR